MMLELIRKFKTLIAIAAILGITGLSSAQAATCKGMSESKCSGSDSCTWVNGYKTKSGKEVASYCRNKSSKKKGMEKSKTDKADKKASKKADKADKKAAKADKKAAKKAAKADKKAAKADKKSTKKSAKADKKASKKKTKDKKK